MRIKASCTRGTGIQLRLVAFDDLSFEQVLVLNPPSQGSMPQSEFILDFSALETYECGAMLLALLAYPVDASDTHRPSLHASLCSEYLRDRYANAADEAIPQLLKPIYAFRKERDVKKDLKTLERRLRDRLVAARIIMGFLQEASGSAVRLPTGVTRLSLNQLSVLVQTDANQTDPENVESRIWRPSIPVIHIAAAVAVALNDSVRAGVAETSWGDILASRSLIEQIVRYSQLFEIYIENNERIRSQLHIVSDKLIKVRLMAD
jgi:hypothetical protein